MAGGTAALLSPVEDETDEGFDRFSAWEGSWDGGTIDLLPLADSDCLGTGSSCPRLEVRLPESAMLSPLVGVDSRLSSEALQLIIPARLE